MNYRKIRSMIVVPAVFILALVMSCGERTTEPLAEDDGEWTWDIAFIHPGGYLLNDVSGFGAGNLVVAGESGAVVSYDGTEWTAPDIGTIVHVSTICAVTGGATEVWSSSSRVDVITLSGRTLPGEYQVNITVPGEQAVVTAPVRQSMVLGQEERLTINGVEIFLSLGMTQLQVVREVDLYSSRTRVEASVVGGCLALWFMEAGDNYGVSVVSTIQAMENSSGIGTQALHDSGQHISGYIGPFFITGTGRLLEGPAGTAIEGLSVEVYGEAYAGTITIRTAGDRFLCLGTDGGSARMEDGTWYASPSDCIACISHFDMIQFSPEEFIKVGEGGNVVHLRSFLGFPIQRDEIRTGVYGSLYGVWSCSSEYAWAVGASGAIVEYDGTTWNLIDSGIEGNLFSVWGSSPMDVYAVGERGTILHYDGVEWIPVQSPVSYSLHDIWGNDSGEIFAVGSSGTILYFNGSEWILQESGTDESLRGVWGDEHGNVYAAGSGGIVLRATRE